MKEGKKERTTTPPIKKLDSCWGCSRTRPSPCKHFFWKARGLVSLESIISGSATHRIHRFLHWIWRVSFRSTFKITKLLAIVDGNYPAQLLPNNVVKTLGGVWGEFWHWSNVSAPNAIGQKIQVFNREGWQRIFRIGETTWRSICSISLSVPLVNVFVFCVCNDVCVPHRRAETFSTIWQRIFRSGETT